ncbi:hypothetical protein LguiA_017728 [Lonicera macranthoides]
MDKAERLSPKLKDQKLEFEQFVRKKMVPMAKRRVIEQVPVEVKKTFQQSLKGVDPSFQRGSQKDNSSPSNVNEQFFWRFNDSERSKVSKGRFEQYSWRFKDGVRCFRLEHKTFSIRLSNMGNSLIIVEVSKSKSFTLNLDLRSIAWFLKCPKQARLNVGGNTFSVRLKRDNV